MTFRGMLVAAGMVFSLHSGAHVLEGCWAGKGSITLAPFPKSPCERIVLKHEMRPGALVMKALAMQCPNFEGYWQEKNLEVRNGNEIWGSPDGEAPKILGWLDERSYWFDEPVNAMQFIEFKGERHASTGRLNWIESFAQNQKIYWRIEADLASVPCEGVER
jgi:hypothetical protein